VSLSLSASARIRIGSRTRALISMFEGMGLIESDYKRRLATTGKSVASSSNIGITCKMRRRAVSD
jgi:hypothetical protein